MRIVILVGMLLLCIFSGAIAQEISAHEQAEIDTRTEEISKTLRCVVCQNQSIYDSNAPLAEDMRNLVRKRVEAGDSNDEAREYLRARYGDYVLMSPPLQMNTILLWTGPLFLVAIGLIWFVVRLRSGQRAPAPAALSEADKARVAEVLNQDKSV
jgi:cytochrome c-type biogenesis protein CcmH